MLHNKHKQEQKKLPLLLIYINFFFYTALVKLEFNNSHQFPNHSSTGVG